MALAAFDLVTAVLAIWLRVNLVNRSLSGRLLWSLCGILFTFTVSRVVVGIALAPRSAGRQYTAGPDSPVYGNNLAHQITSTFDVVLCGLALWVLGVAIVTGDRFLRRRQDASAHSETGSPTRDVRPPADAETTELPAGGGRPRIFRSGDSA